MNNNTTLTPQEVADILKIAKNTVYELVKRGELNSYKVGRKLRIDLQDVENYKTKSKNKTVHINSVVDPVITTTKIENPIISPMPRTIMAEDIKYSKGFVICGQDIILDILSSHLEHKLNGIPALRSYVGSYNGLYALYQGTAQLATTHLWDGDTGKYNIPYVRRMLPGVPSVIIRLVSRMQGFYVKKGNPKGITDWKDLLRSDISIINREKGSGTRVLLDERLRLMGVFGSSIQGYSRESFSHFAVASTVARGGADLSLGIEKIALQVQGIDFIPMQEEQYDLVIKKEDIEKPEFETVLKIINSKEFKMELQGIGSYNITETGKVISEI
ncbi:PBP superfamily domain protein [Clostridium homopropionicum DSM 5847]|uniref:PBP superfamily domain protein n=1 Tax=Clostridium homopropionicum DSM 5847 TaxID=1121318 RepID=A0A0L6Z6P1_9CLOT|nr:helix-turn-helix transcriptional regulator [Clostridium homopropionicum]KOA18626.1 PBP superfamily domain protein [Clostridium homopropionicum DSM 5847]SFG50524.1 putative molybdopterin biosynthesis protein [Clostridium homopropionicum]